MGNRTAVPNTIADVHPDLQKDSAGCRAFIRDPYWHIRQTLWQCACRFIGVQKALRPGGDLVLFQTISRRPTSALSVPFHIFDTDVDPIIAQALIKKKVQMSRQERWPEPEF
jgi:hypothetical protein